MLLRGQHCPLEVSLTPVPSSPRDSLCSPTAVTNTTLGNASHLAPAEVAGDRVCFWGPLKGEEREEAVTGLVLTHGPYQTAEYFQRASRLPRGADGNTPVCSEMGHTAHSWGN